MAETTTIRRSSIRCARSTVRLAATIALLALALAMNGSTARAAGVVEIVGPAGTQTVDLAQLTPDVVRHTYTLVATPDGAPGTVTVAEGYSLPMILKQVGSPSVSFHSVEIAAPQGPPVVLNDTQATSPYAYSLAGPPVVWEDGAGAHFLVPSVPGGNITGAGETFATPTIMIKLHHGPALSVGISRLGAVVGKPVQFQSTVAGAPAPFSYQWSFGDNASASQADPSHTYAHTGTYNVYLQVTGSEDSVGASSVIHVVVGNPPPRPSATGAGGAGSGSGSAGAAGGQGSGAGSHAGTTTPGGTATTPAGRTRAKRPVHPRAPRASRPTGPLVSGIAISYLTPLAGASGGAAGGARAARAAHLRANARGLQEGMWIWFGVLVVLFAGGLLELRGSWRAPAAIAEAP